MAKSLLFRWRKEAGLSGKRRNVEGFVPVRIATPPVISLPPPSAVVPVTHEAGSIEIELAGGSKLRVIGTVKPDALRQVIAALRN